MKIDIHVHTRKCKQGDAPTREIEPSRFAEIASSTDVQIFGITNHNVFDLQQFNEIEELIEEHIQVWPGVELDIVEDGNRGHLLVIVSPEHAEEFRESVQEITEGETPDSFTTTIANTLEHFDDYGPLYIAHYKQKKPAMSDDSIQALIDGTQYPSRVLKEVSNAISAGIYISHGRASIYGSDVQNWDKYVGVYSKSLPVLRLAVESFEQFCLLLEKDPTTINTLLDERAPEELTLKPFEDETIVKLKVYNDINVLFGSKGTGKSRILEAVSRHYCDKGMEATVFTPASDELDEIYEVNRKSINTNLNNHGINYCRDEIEAIRGAREIDITNLSNYISYFQGTKQNKNAKKIRFKDIERQGERKSEANFGSYNESFNYVDEFLDFMNENKVIKKELNNLEHKDLVQMLTTLQIRLNRKRWKFFSKWKANSLINSAVKRFRIEVQRKTGNPGKPSTTGFLEYAKRRIEIEIYVNEILKNIQKSIPNQVETIGSLGPDKGILKYEEKVKFQDGNITDGSLRSDKNINKTPQKLFSKAIKNIAENVYEDNLFELIAELNQIEDTEGIKTIFELLLFKRYFTLDGKPYKPSSGEASMVMLHRELDEERDIYILDEPERSLGNEYISDVIVPLLNERARAGKKIFISTHDANIAVRTLPYCSIYRTHDAQGYDTYIGNPYTNNLINADDPEKMEDWKQVSMNTLEGGVEAFGERGKIYGHN